MAGMGRYPKDESTRRNRHALTFDWTTLPLEGRQGPPPTLPPLRVWTEATLDEWARLWRSPQATMWDQSGRTLHAWAILHHHYVTDEKGERVASLAAEMRQHEDRHGLSPKAMLQLRWRISTQPADGSGKVLHLVPAAVAARVREGRPDPAQRPAKRAAKADWVAWAVAHGLDQAAAELLSKQQLVEMFSSVAEEGSPLEPEPEPVRPTSAALDRLSAGVERAAKRKSRRRPARD